jgi:MYXO-CTERM domain-containing protein
VPLFPIDGETIPDLIPTPEWAPAFDPDRDPLTYDVRVTDDDGVLITQGSTAARDSWVLDVSLDEDTWYLWSVRAVDDEGATGDWCLPERFFVSTANAAPGEVVFVSPEEGEVLGSMSPTLAATETSDPEGDLPVYHFTLDTELDDGADPFETWVEHTGTGEVGWALALDDIELTPNVNWVGRVRAEDSEGIGGPWAQVVFFVRGVNDAPPVPELISPDEGAQVESAEFVLGAVDDPDGDPVTYSVRVGVSEDFAEVVAFAEGLEADGDTVVWTASDVGGTLYWSARAVDNSGVPSGWSETREVVVGGPLAGCGTCSSAPRRGMPGALAALLALAILPLRRRRPRGMK